MLTKLREILQPESVDTRKPAIQKNTHGRLSAKDKKGKATQVPDLNEVPNVDHRRCTTSKSTQVPNFNKERARHSSYTGPSVQHELRYGLYSGDVESEYFMDQIPVIFHPYIISVYNVVGDGNCGFWCVAHGICENQNRWREVRQMLLQELHLHREVYTSMWSEFGFNRICYSVNWFEYEPAPEDRYMEM
jgi:hypothetical protein